LQHLVTSQRGYLALLTLPGESRSTSLLGFAELQKSARISGARVNSGGSVPHRAYLLWIRRAE
jgi:hypothetical protein